MCVCYTKITHTQIFRDVFGMKRTPICKFPAVKERDASKHVYGYRFHGLYTFIIQLISGKDKDFILNAQHIANDFIKAQSHEACK